MDYCSGCGLCTQACPQGVKIAELNAHARRKLKLKKGVPLRDRLIARPTVLGRIGTPVAPLANASLKTRPVARARREAARHPPRRAGAQVRQAAASAPGRSKHKSPPASQRIVYFHGCGTQYYEPDVGEKTVAILEHNGFKVDVPLDQDCCGLPLQSNGLFDDARKYVLRLAKSLAPAARDGALIVGQLHELHGDAQARGARDPRPRGRPRSQARQRAHLRHLRAAARDAHRGELQTPTSSRSRRASPTTRPASSRATGSASRRSSCST